MNRANVGSPIRSRLLSSVFRAARSGPWPYAGAATGDGPSKCAKLDPMEKRGSIAVLESAAKCGRRLRHWGNIARLRAGAARDLFLDPRDSIKPGVRMASLGCHDLSTGELHGESVFAIYGV